MKLFLRSNKRVDSHDLLLEVAETFSSKFVVWETTSNTQFAGFKVGILVSQYLYFVVYMMNIMCKWKVWCLTNFCWLSAYGYFITNI